MSIPIISFEDGEKLLDWKGFIAALAAGHKLPKAEVADSFLYRGKDTLLNRAAWIDGLGLAVKSATIFPGNPDRCDLNCFITKIILEFAFGFGAFHTFVL